VNEYEDGHSVQYWTRSGRGPRGGRATFVIARCRNCRAEVEWRDSRAGAQEGLDARLFLVHRYPTCPAVPPVPPHDQLLLALAALFDAAAGPLSAVPFEWAVAHAGGTADVDAAVQHAWTACADAGLMRHVLKALHQKELMGAPKDELGNEWISFECDGLDIDLTGPSARVAAAVRMHMPRLAWRKDIP